MPPDSWHDNPSHPIYRWLAGTKYVTVAGLARALGLTHQVLSYRINGKRWTSLEFVKQIQVESRGLVRLRDWPKVWHRASGQRWLVGVPQLRSETPRHRGKPAK